MADETIFGINLQKNNVRKKKRIEEMSDFSCKNIIAIVTNTYGYYNYYFLSLYFVPILHFIFFLKVLVFSQTLTHFYKINI